MSIWFRALVSSAIVSVLVAGPVAFVLPKAIAYSPVIPWDKAKNLRYGEVLKLMSLRAHEVRAWASIYGNLRDPWAWRSFATIWVVLTGLCFVACCVVLLWQRRSAI